MDSAVFMERYGYRILLGATILLIAGIIVAASGTLYNLIKEFGGYMVLIIVAGIVVYVLISRGRSRNEKADVERGVYENGLRRY
jgi:hypothetical protein